MFQLEKKNIESLMNELEINVDKLKFANLWNDGPLIYSQASVEKHVQPSE